MKNLSLDIDEAKGIAVVTFDRPGSSANIFDRETLEELDSALDEIEWKSTVKKVVFVSAKPRIFIAGADLKSLASATESDMDEFLKLGQELFSRIAALPMGTAAAIHGACVGGGLEMSLACDVRVASGDKATKIGLPETLLGIIPSWGGSTRFPKLIGIPQALSLILSGKTLAPGHARKLGVVDDVVPRERLVQRAAQLLERPPRRKSHWKTNNPVVAAVIRGAAKRRLRKRTRGHYPALFSAVRVVTSAPGRSEKASFKMERDEVVELARGEVTRQLIRLYFLTEKSKKFQVEGGGKVPPVRRCAVIGAGVMGAGIAHWLAAREFPVLLKDLDEEAVARGLKTIRKRFDESVERRIFTRGEGEARFQLVSPATGDVSLELADIVIEAAVENMEIKKKIFADLASRTRADAILATNTSALSITELSGAVSGPERVVGLHFFNPVHRMKLVEVIHTGETSPAVSQACIDLVRKLGKSPVLVRDSPGFLVNRILMPYLIEAGRLLEDGVDPKRIDDAMLEFGMPVGPLRLLDDIGLDVALHVAETMEDFFGDRMTVPGILPELVERGMTGRKSGEGIFSHRGRDKGEVNAAATSLVKGGLEMGRDEISDRLALLMVAESYRCLEEGIVGSPDELDFAMIMGTGWAPFRGGPMAYANSLGKPEVRQRIEGYFDRDGPVYAVPNALGET